MLSTGQKQWTCSRESCLHNFRQQGMLQMLQTGHTIKIMNLSLRGFTVGAGDESCQDLR